MESSQNAKIFSAVQELMASEEFVNAQLTFMQANVQAFDENDENKLEYTGIYESYVKIMEDIIDAKLIESFPKDDIESFYANFRDNYQSYEAQDKETVDSLFELTDFVRFKDSMLAKKSAIVKDGNAGGEVAGTADLDGGSKEFWFSLHAENHDDKSSGWKLRLKFSTPNKGIIDSVVHSKKYEGFAVDISRSAATFPGISMENFDSYMMNIDKLYEKKGGNGTTFNIVERDADNYPSMCYFSFKMPMFMTDRDGCFKFTR